MATVHCFTCCYHGWPNTSVSLVRTKKTKTILPKLIDDLLVSCLLHHTVSRLLQGSLVCYQVNLCMHFFIFFIFLPFSFYLSFQPYLLSTIECNLCLSFSFLSFQFNLCNLFEMSLEHTLTRQPFLFVIWSHPISVEFIVITSDQLKRWDLRHVSTCAKLQQTRREDSTAYVVAIQ